jgi:hypothetical protein
MAGSGQVRHLGRGLCGLIHDVLGDRAWQDPVSISKGELEWVLDKHTIGDGVVGTCGICGGSYRQLVRARKDRKWLSSCETLAQLARCRQQRQKNAGGNWGAQTLLALAASTLGWPLVAAVSAIFDCYGAMRA